MGYDTANNIVNDAALELSLVRAAVDDVFASTDQNLVLLRTLLTSVGQDLVRVHEWTHLQKEKTFTTDGSGSYALPDDFRSMIDQTGWNRSSSFPLGGPMSPQEWQFATAVSAASPLTVLFRPARGVLLIYQDVTGTSIAYEYRSTYWVQPTGQTSPTAEATSAKTDTLKLPRLLLLRGLKLAFLRAKGMPSDAAYIEYVQSLNAARADDSAAPVLNAGGRNHDGPRLIDLNNLPETGFGS